MLRRVLVGLVMLAMVASPLAAMAADGAQPAGDKPAVSSGNWSLLSADAAAYLAAGFGAALVIIGGAKGISHIGGNAVDAMARQPEAAGNINAATIITAAMVEGATLFAVVVCLLLVLK